MSSFPIVIMAIALFLMVLGNYKIRVKYKLERTLKEDAMEKINSLKDELIELKNENEALIENIGIMQDLIRNSSGISKDVLEKIGIKAKNKNIVHGYNDLLLRIDEELERKRRYEFFKFSLVEVHIDKISEYKEIYGNSFEEFYEKIVEVILSGVRKVDYFATGVNEEELYIIAPVTDMAGGIILGSRLQQLATGVSEKEVVTLTISLCEVDSVENSIELIDEISRMRNDAVKSGGNTIKVSKI